MRRANKGVTLMELLIVVAIIGVLGAIAYPNYARYVTRANRSDATVLLLKVAAAQEKYYAQNNTYATLAQISAAPFNLGASEHGWYNLAISALGANLSVGYTAEANAVSTAKQYADTDCRRFTITSAGVKDALKSDLTTGNKATCWK